jgi:uncharacterized protein YdeI (YjbR/CyaY-like superfamily)
MEMTKDIETYLLEGCGRCELGGTPDCKVHTWASEIRELRRIVLSCGLDEEVKWGNPCYTFQGNNVLMIAAFKQFVSLSFFKGVLLQDLDKLLDQQGENSQSVRVLKFTEVQPILELEVIIKTYIYEAIEVEKKGLKVSFKAKDELVYPDELLQAFESHEDLKMAFEALTPGRQRGFILHFTQPKKSETRVNRIEKCKSLIFEGKGLQGR